LANQREARVGRRPGNQDTRGQIITAARQAFAAKGFAGASMRGIAAEAGVDAALIHHYFENKEQLFLATVALPLEMPQKLEGSQRRPRWDRRAPGRTVLGVWDSDLQPTLIAGIRTTLTDPR
jgi:AcrR family transcriptional regulator